MTAGSAVVRCAGCFVGAGVGVAAGGFGTALVYDGFAGNPDDWTALAYGLVGAAIGLPLGAAAGDVIAAQVERRATTSAPRLILSTALGAGLSLEIALLSGLVFSNDRWSWARVATAATIGATVAVLTRSGISGRLEPPPGAGVVARGLMEGIGMGLGLLGGVFLIANIDFESRVALFLASAFAGVAGFLIGGLLATLARPPELG